MKFLLFAILFAASVAVASPKKLIVVAPAKFQESLGDFIEHKKKLLPTELQVLEQILEKGEGVDDPEKLKKHFFSEWQKGELGYVLLVGDVDIMPVRYMVLDRITPAAFDYSFYPSDLYYSDLAKSDRSFEDWNARKDGFHAGYFGEVRGEKNKSDAVNYDQVDYQPEIAVGRWPVSTPVEAKLIAEKTIRYEQGKTSGNKAALVSLGGWVDTRSRMDRLGTKLEKNWQTEKRYFSDKRKEGGTPPPDRPQVRGLFNEGVVLAFHTGHGQPDQWEQCFFMRDLDRITNSSSLPIIMSAGCSTAYFAPLAPYDGYVDVHGVEHIGTDKKQVFTGPPPPPSPYQKGKYNPTGLGEQFLKRSTNGAVAYIGCNTGSQPCGLTLLDGFVGAIAESKEPRLGDCWAEAVRYYYKTEKLDSLKPDSGWYPPTIFFQAMKFMLFGDPSLKVQVPSSPST